MQHDARAYLNDIVETAVQICKAIDAVGIDEYRSSWILRSAIERGLITIGEALNRLSEVMPGIRESISGFSDIVGLRNRLTHAYMSIDDDIIFASAKTDVPVLKQECEALLKTWQ